MAKPKVAIIGAGVSGLTCGVLLAERGYRTAIFAEQVGQRTTSGAAAAIWFPYDAEPAEKVIAWSLATYERFRELAHDPQTGVSMLELRCFARAGELPMPEWSLPLGASRIRDNEVPEEFTSGFSIGVPLIDTTLYLDYLADRLLRAGGSIDSNVHVPTPEEVTDDFTLLVNCAGLGAKTFVGDADLEPHRGQVAVVAKLDLLYAVVCDDPPLMYAIPRANDCVFGGTNSISENLAPDPAQTSEIIAECARVLKIAAPPIVRERVGLRPFRRSGVRLESERLRSGRRVIHNYGHGGSGFTLSWGCAEDVARLVSAL